MVLNTAKICTAVFLSYFLSTMKEKQVQKICFSGIWNLQTVCQHIDTQWRAFSLSKSESLTQPIQMQLYQIKKYFRNFFYISGIYTKFAILWRKRWTAEVICFWIYKLQTAVLLKCTKSHVSEQLWTVNMLNGPKHCINLHSSIFIRFFDCCERKSAPETLFR